MRKKFFMPEEWKEHSKTYMEFPVRESLWKEKISEVQESYAEVANKISEFEKLVMICDPKKINIAKRLLSSEIEILELEHDDSWMRDNGPTFLVDDENETLSAIVWRFNSWGERYIPYDKEAKVAKELVETLKIPYIESKLIMEGGSFHVNGKGKILTTEECLLNKNRNPNHTKIEIENELKEKLGGETVIWLPYGLYEDDTDGHIDNIAVFIDEKTILMQDSNEDNSANKKRYTENRKIIESFGDLNLVTIQEPPERFYNKIRLSQSYINFYFVNGGIILPKFGGDAKKMDEMASDFLKEFFPNRKIVSLDGTRIILGGGNIHCITQQVPKVKEVA
ncbi:MAG: agmatine deiminase family protein [Leptospiraceae bacterium]|nr:agmatine deiminase family protein [Leptospiraceae bacterium]